MSKIKLEYKLDLFVVGRSENTFRMHYAVGAKLPGPLFSHCQVTLHAGLTKKDEFTLGPDGTSNIDLAGFKYFNTKKSFLKGLKNYNIDDYLNHLVWLNKVKFFDNCKFTDALINSIFHKTLSTKLWINRDWSWDQEK